LATPDFRPELTWAAPPELVLTLLHEEHKVDSRELVTDRELFLSLGSECDRVVDTTKRLPDRVFRQAFARYYAIEYPHVYREEFGTFLSQIAHVLQDNCVHYMALDPNPEEFYRQSRVYGAISLDSSNLVQRYATVMNPTRGISGILAGANVGAFWGSSLRWAIVGDRISWELAIIGVPDEVDVARISDFGCLNTSSLEEYVQSQYRAKNPSGSIARDFTRRFLANYPCG
jgi:hypothetical protein